MWWPQLNAAIDDLAKKCEWCSMTASTSPAAPVHRWLVPHGPWECIHVDHAQWKTLVAVDAFLKWPEVFVVKSTSATQSADKLRRIFATHGLPVTLVSDNGPPFLSEEIHRFMTSNGITHRRVPPYHPSSNGMAENMVKSVIKQGRQTGHNGNQDCQVFRWVS